jgi:membrane-bound metal-dependent hydrolase YbcI (DUF457 family)
MSKPQRVLAVIAVAAAIVAFDYVVEFLTIDSCMDRGGAIDYASMECVTDLERSLTFEHVPYAKRNREFLVSIGFAAFVVGIAVCFWWKPRLRS